MVLESMDFEQLLAESKSRLVRALTSRGLTLTPDRMDLVQTVFENTARELWTKMKHQPPTTSPSLSSIKVREGGEVIGWHPIGGVWTHIMQIPLEDNSVRYYTNGKRDEPIVERPNNGV